MAFFAACHYPGAIVLAGIALCLGLHAIGILSAQSAQRRFVLWPATAM